MASVKTAISVPAELFRLIDRSARRAGVSRSQFFVKAAARYLKEIGDREITRRLDQVYSEPELDEDRLSRELAQDASLQRARGVW